MNKKYALSITIIMTTVTILIACQPESAVQDPPSPTTDLPELPSVVVKTSAAQTATPMSTTPMSTEVATIVETNAPATVDAGDSGEDANIPSNNTPVPFVEIPPTAEPLAALARTDLAVELGVSEDEIAVVSVVAVMWPDGSFGCPQPGMQYAQVLTPGYQILLSYNGVEIEYHSDEFNTVVKCVGNILKPVPTMPFDPADIKEDEPGMPVD